MRDPSIRVPLFVILSGLGLTACQPVVPNPADEPPWLGIVKSAQVKAFLDSAALSNSDPIVPSVLRFRYTEPQRLSDDTRPFQESRTTVEIDCGKRRGRTVDLHLYAPDGSHLANVPLEPDVAAWKPFDQHSLYILPGRMYSHGSHQRAVGPYRRFRTLTARPLSLCTCDLSCSGSTNPQSDAWRLTSA